MRSQHDPVTIDIPTPPPPLLLPLPSLPLLPPRIQRPPFPLPHSRPIVSDPSLSCHFICHFSRFFFLALLLLLSCSLFPQKSLVLALGVRFVVAAATVGPHRFWILIDGLLGILFGAFTGGTLDLVQESRSSDINIM
jgi:hypothetical protein